MIETRLHRASAVATEHKGELKNVTASLVVFEKAKAEAKGKHTDTLRENSRLQQESMERKELGEKLAKQVADLSEAAKQFEEQLKVAEAENVQLREQLVAAKKTAEEVGPTTVAEYKKSEEFLDIQEVSFDQGFNHFARCLWSAHGRDSACLEELASWADLS